MLDFKNYELNYKHETYNQLGLKRTQNIEYKLQHTNTTYYAVNKSKSIDWNSRWILWVKNAVTATAITTI